MRLIGIEMRIGVEMKMSDEIMVIRGDGGLIKGFMGEEKLIEFCMVIKGGEIREKLMVMEVVGCFV